MAKGRKKKKITAINMKIIRAYSTLHKDIIMM